MPITLQRERTNVYRMEIRGLLRKADLDRSQRRLLSWVVGSERVRLLVVLDHFEGWELGANWHDLSFYLHHGDKIERIAIVGPEQWHTETMMFAAADLRTAPVEYFLEDEALGARAWLLA